MVCTVIGCSLLGCESGRPVDVADSSGAASDSTHVAQQPESGETAKAGASAAPSPSPESEATAETVDSAADDEVRAPSPDFEHLRTQSAVVDRALGLKDAIDAANRNDLHLLWAHVQDLIRPLDADARVRLRTQVAERIDHDAAQLRRMQVHFREGPGRARWWDGLELRKAVDQFLGVPGETAGIYDDARALMNRPEYTNPFNPQLADMYLQPHLTAGLKTLLLYAAVAGNGLANAGELELTSDLKLIYRVRAPDSLPRELFDGVTLVNQSGDAPQFLIPNAGFVMGGTFQDGQNRGVDCSAFVSHCTDRADRLTTWVMEFCWRELAHGVGDFSGSELSVRKEFLDQWGLKQALVDFEAVEFDSLDDLLPGDVLVRRWGDPRSGNREGNSTLFLAPRADGTVWGIECNRLYNPHTGERKDGVVYRDYDLFQPSVDVYVLRRVQ